jgi:hypothetical protein
MRIVNNIEKMNGTIQSLNGCEVNGCEVETIQSTILSSVVAIGVLPTNT